MPTYDYRCEKCGDFEISQKMSDAALTVCPTCGSAVQRLISAPAFHLKGSGWYKTDYASGSSSSASSSASNGSVKPKSAESSGAASDTSGGNAAAAPAADSGKTPSSE